MFSEQDAFFMVVMVTVAISFVLSLAGRKPDAPERVAPKDGARPWLSKEDVLKNLCDRK